MDRTKKPTLFPLWKNVLTTALIGRCSLLTIINHIVAYDQPNSKCLERFPYFYIPVFTQPIKTVTSRPSLCGSISQIPFMLGWVARQQEILNWGWTLFWFSSPNFLILLSIVLLFLYEDLQSWFFMLPWGRVMVFRLFYIPFAVILYCPFSYTGNCSYHLLWEGTSFLLGLCCITLVQLYKLRSKSTKTDAVCLHHFNTIRLYNLDKFWDNYGDYNTKDEHKVEDRKD
jgi:hypothetical protein